MSVSSDIGGMSQQDIIHLKIDRGIKGQDGSRIFQIFVIHCQRSGVCADLFEDRSSFGALEPLHLLGDGSTAFV